MFKEKRKKEKKQTTYGLLQLASERLALDVERVVDVPQLDDQAVVVVGLHAQLGEHALQLPVGGSQLTGAALLSLQLSLQVTQLAGEKGIVISQ